MLQQKQGPPDWGGPCFANLLSVNQLTVYNFHCTCLDIVHLTDPCHLVGSFQRLGDTLGSGHLFNNGILPFLCLLDNIGKVAVQSAVEQQGIV